VHAFSREIACSPLTHPFGGAIPLKIFIKMSGAPSYGKLNMETGNHISIPIVLVTL
jgi:hypothetical protein